MSSSAFDPHESPLDNHLREGHLREEQPAASDSRSSSDRNSRRDLFEEVMRQTQELCDEGAEINGTEINSAEKEAILEVARKFQGQPFSLDPVLGELVRAVLRSRLPERAGSGAAWREISAEIAETLFEDPVSRDRLERFWSRLMDSCLAVGDES